MPQNPWTPPYPQSTHWKQNWINMEFGNQQQDHIHPPHHFQFSSMQPPPQPQLTLPPRNPPPRPLLTTQPASNPNYKFMQLYFFMNLHALIIIKLL